MRDVLADLTEIEGVRAAFLTGTDGLVIAAQGEIPDAADLRAALIAAIFATIDRGISHLDVGSVRQASIETSTHIIYVVCLGELLLVVITERETSSGIVRWEMRRAARLLARVSA